ncbi:MAG: LCP family protein [Floccifex sp.]
MKKNTFFEIQDRFLYDEKGDRMKKEIGLLLAVLCSTFYFFYKIIEIQIIPWIYISFIFVFIIFILALIVYSYHKKHTLIAGLLSIALIICSLGSGYYLHQMIQTLSNISYTNQTKKKTISIYALKDTSQDLEKGVIGYLAMNEEKSMECLNEYSKGIEAIGYSSSENMIHDFLDGLLDGICLDQSYLEIISEFEDMEDFEEKVKVIYQYTYTIKTADTISSVDVINEPFIVLVSGIDTRTGSFEDSDSRSDVNLVITINPNTHQIYLVSIPRDYYVQTVCEQGDGCANGEMDKLTHTGWHGISTTEKTIENLLDIEINYNVLVNFQTIVTFVDLLDGVDVYSEYDTELSASFHACSVQEGMNHLNGECALAYARERYAYADGDRQRGKNQMEIVSAIIKKCCSTAILDKIPDILNIMEDLFQTNMETGQILSFVRQQLSQGNEWSVYTYSLNGTGATDYAYELQDYAYVMYPDETTIQNAKEDIENIMEGKEPIHVN